jgi:hypothetical protein
VDAEPNDDVHDVAVQGRYGARQQHDGEAPNTPVHERRHTLNGTLSLKYISSVSENLLTRIIILTF